MAVSASLLTAKIQGGGSSIVTASVTPTANRLVLAAVSSKYTFGGTLPTVSGNSLTYVQVATLANSDYRITLFRAMGASPAAGAVTASFGGISQIESSITVTEFGGVLTSGTNGADAVAQSATDSNISAGLTVTLSSFVRSSNGTFGAFFKDLNSALSAGSGFTALASGNSGSGAYLTEFQAANDTSVDVGGSGSAFIIGVAAEIAATINTVTGVGSMALTVTAHGAGTPTVKGAGSAALTATMTAAGTPTVMGVGNAPIVFTAHATVPTTVTGTGLAAFLFLATAVQTITGTGSAALTFTATAQGGRVVTGVGSARFTFTAHILALSPVEAPTHVTGSDGATYLQDA